MKIFDKFKKKEESILDAINKSDWMQVFSAILGKMMVIQNNASEYVVKNRNWNVNFAEGYIAFGEDRYPVQLIGSESSISNTWNWGWNNVNHFDDHLITLANEILDKGENWQLDPLRMAQFELNDIFNGHYLAIVACGISDDQYFYYRGPHDKGAVLMAVGNLPKEVFSAIDMQEFVNLTLQCLEQFPIDHKIFVEGLLQWNKTPYYWKKNILTCCFSNELYLTFEKVDNHYRLISMKNK